MQRLLFYEENLRRSAHNIYNNNNREITLRNIRPFSSFLDIYIIKSRNEYSVLSVYFSIDDFR
jgi:hypothetical protein